MQRYLASRLVKTGLVLFALGCGPLLLVILAEAMGLVSDSNPIGLGILAMITFWPSVIIGGVGVVGVARQNAARPASGARNRVLMIPIEDVEPGSRVTALAQSMPGRSAAALLGLVLIGNGLASLDDGGRGAASALVIGMVCIGFAVAGRIPEWFRR